MTIQLVNGGEVLVLSYLVNKEAPQNLVLRLFKSDTTVVNGSVVGDLTESDFSGYEAIELIGDDWTVTPDDPSYAVAAQQNFTSDADQALQTAYGYYLTRVTGGELVWAERLPTAQAIQNSGDRVQVTARVEASDDAD